MPAAEPMGSFYCSGTAEEGEMLWNGGTAGVGYFPQPGWVIRSTWGAGRAVSVMVPSDHEL